MITRVSLRAVSLGDDVRQIAPLGQRMGYGALQLDLRIGSVSLLELTASGQREFRSLLAQYDLALESLRMQLPADGLAATELHDRALWAISKAIDAAAGLKAGLLCIDLGRLPAAKGDAPPSQAIKPQDAGRIIIPELAAPVAEAAEEKEDRGAWDGIDSVMRELGTRADKTGITLAFSSELSSFASLKRAVEKAACPWFGVDLDPVSVLRDRWDMEHVLDAIGGMLRHVRARDAMKGSAGRTQPAAIGRGSTNWTDLLAMLDSGGYRGWVAVDTVDLADRVREAQSAVGLLAAARG